jgi:transcriptional regulator with XRE-family HTH domain
MNVIGKKIAEIRKAKGLTQEELAELSKVNLRTIQRIENNENVPRGKTLSLIFDVLEIDPEDLKILEKKEKKKSYVNIIIQGIFLIILNLVIILTYGYMTLDSKANLNSRFAGVLLSFLLPYFIVSKTRSMSGLERLLKFGSGHFYYFILIIVNVGFPKGFATGLFPCLAISIAIMFYGEKMFKTNE